MKDPRAGYVYDMINAEIHQIWVPDIDKFNSERRQKYKNMTKTKEAEEIIQESFITQSSIYNGPYNKTTLFLLPMLELTLRNPVVKKYLKNAYLDDADFEHDFTRPLFLLLRTKSFEEKEFKDLCTILRSKMTFKVDYDLGKQDGDNLVMYVFEIPEKWKENYYHFKAGRYSKFTDPYKILFPKEILDGTKKVESLVYGVIYKTAYRKDQVASHFCVKDGEGKIKDTKEYETIRKGLDQNQDIWEMPMRHHEIMHWKS